MIIRVALQAAAVGCVVGVTFVLTTVRTASEPDLITANSERTDYVRGVSTTAPKKKNSSAGTNNPTLTGAQTTSLNSCGSLPATHKGLALSNSPELRKLAQYEAICHGALTSKFMVFTNMPKDSTEAVADATDLALRLKEFARFKIEPLVIQEPTTSKGNISFADYKAGDYDQIMQTYFTTLNDKGITSRTMGTWVPFPEANIPEWDNTKPADFVTCVTKAIKLQKQTFPSSKASILLESTTYPDGTWASGKQVSLLPYVKNIPKGLVDSFGYQGFPWPDVSPDYNAGHFLRPDLAIQAAKAMGVKSVWFNTGSFNRGRTDSGKLIKLLPAVRQKILLDILAQAKKIKLAGYSVSINLFSQNKLNVSEGIDWSYWVSPKAATSPSVPAFKTFVNSSRASGVKLWLFDSAED